MAVDIGMLRGLIELDDRFTSKLKIAQSQMAAAGQKWQQVGSQMKAAGAAMLPLSIATAAVGVGAIKAFGDFDSAMTQSLAIMDDTAQAMKGEMSDAAREMAKTTVFSAKEAAESYFFLASAGMSAEESLGALPIVAQFAQAGMFDMALATDLLTDAQSALGLNTGTTAEKMLEMARVGDVLVKANTMANATVEQFATSLTTEAAAAMKSFGIDVEEGVAVLAAFADQGIKGQVAGTGLSRILRLMTSAAVKNADAYKELGVEVFDANDKINNMADIIEDLELALGDLSDAERVAALDTLGFKARVQGVILPLLGTSEKIREMDAALRDAGGTMKTVADRQMETFNKQMGLLKDQFVDVGIELGRVLVPMIQNLIPMISGMADKLRGVVDVFAALPDPIKKTAFALGLIVTALPALLFGLGSLVQVLGFAATGLSMLAGTTVGVAAVAVFVNLGNTVPVLTARLWLMNVAANASIASIGTLIGIIAVPAIIAAAAAGFAILAVKIAEANAEAEDAALALANINGVIMDNALAVNDLKLAYQDAGVDGLRVFLDEMDPAVVKSQEFSKQLADLFNAGRITHEEFLEISDTIAAYRDEIGEAIPVQDDLATSAKDLAGVLQEELDAAISSLGLDKGPKAIAMLDDFLLAMDSGQVGATALAEGYLAIKASLDELAAKYPEVAEALGIVTGKLYENRDAAQAVMDHFLGQWKTGKDALIETEFDFADSIDAGSKALAENLAEAEANWRITQLLSEENEAAAVAADKARAEYDNLADAAKEATGTLEDFFASVKTGIPWLDTLISGVARFIDSLIGGGGLGDSLGGIGEMISGLFGGEGGIGGLIGGFFQNLGGAGGSGGIGGIISGLFGGGGPGGLISTIGGLFSGAGAAAGSAFVTALPSAASLASVGATAGAGMGGGFMTALTPLLTNPWTIGIAAAAAGALLLWKKFSGPSAAELEARRIAHSMDEMMISMLDAGQLAEAGGELWKQSNIAIRDSMSALGFSAAEVNAKMAELAEAVRQSPEAAQGVIDSLGPIFNKVQAAMDATGLSMTKLRGKVANAAEKLGLSMADAFDLVVSKGTDASKKITDAWLEAGEAIGGSATTIQEKIDATNVALVKAAEESGGKVTDAMLEMTMNVAELTRQLNETMAAEMAESAESIDDEFRSMTGSLRERFNGMAEDWSENLHGMQDAAEDFSDEMVGHSIIPDMVSKVVLEVGKIGDSFKETADVSAGEMGSMADFGETAASRAHISGPRGGGGDIHVHSNVDGEVLTEMVIKLTPQVLRKLGL